MSEYEDSIPSVLAIVTFIAWFPVAFYLADNWMPVWLAIFWPFWTFAIGLFIYLAIFYMFFHKKRVIDLEKKMKVELKIPRKVWKELTENERDKMRVFLRLKEEMINNLAWSKHTEKGGDYKKVEFYKRKINNKIKRLSHEDIIRKIEAHQEDQRLKKIKAGEKILESAKEFFNSKNYDSAYSEFQRALNCPLDIETKEQIKREIEKINKIKNAERMEKALMIRAEQKKKELEELEQKRKRELEEIERQRQKEEENAKQIEEAKKKREEEQIEKKKRAEEKLKESIKRKILEEERKKAIESEAIKELIEEGQLSEDYTNNYERNPIPTHVKKAVWLRDRGACCKCGSRKDLEFDHIIPVSKGGANTVKNIQLLCMSCNRNKSNKIE